jgi:hypothetical protein
VSPLEIYAPRQNSVYSSGERRRPSAEVQTHPRLYENMCADRQSWSAGEAGKEQNWIQTVPRKDKLTCLRLYGPLETVVREDVAAGVERIHELTEPIKRRPESR